MSYKRLNLEEIKKTDDARYERLRKGTVREVTTPKFSIPYSTEGTYIYQRIDRNDVIAAAENRNDIVQLLKKYPALTIERVRLFYSTDYNTINHSYQTIYAPNITYISPRTYT